MRTTLVTMLCLAAIMLAVFPVGPEALAHSIHYEVQQKGISAKIFYATNDPASYSEYEVYGPADGQPYQIGRTDRAGVLSFLPDRPGIWKIKVLGESSHGFHGVTIEVKVDQGFHLESFSKPLVAQHTKIIVGVSVIFGLFGLLSLYLSRRKKNG
jgi:nickel transport protein